MSKPNRVVGLEERDGSEMSGRSEPQSERRFLGLFVRRSEWFLSFRGWIALIVVAAGLFGTLFLGVHPFLAITERTQTPYLVVEGWIPNYALEESIAEFRSKPYRKMFTVGADILNGVHVDPGDNHADYTAKRLAWLGMKPSLVQAVSSGAHYRDRTYSSALALKAWLDRNEPGARSFNLVTVGVHARRSRLLFEKAFAGRARVGIIAVEDREYDPKRWWAFSEGVKEVISEGAGYIYARLFFHPKEPARE